MVLARVHPSPQVPPDPTGRLHNSLRSNWWLPEFLPHKFFDPVTRKVSWRIPLGARRVIREGSVLHETVLEKLKLDPSYKPSNLPREYSIEPHNRCALG
jgi:hypothetical protein